MIIEGMYAGRRSSPECDIVARAHKLINLCVKGLGLVCVMDRAGVGLRDRAGV